MWTLNSSSLPVNRTVQSLIDQVFQLLGRTPSADDQYVLKLCDTEEYLTK